MQGITFIDYLYCFYYIITYLSGSGLTVIFVCNPIINKIKKKSLGSEVCELLLTQYFWPKVRKVIVICRITI